MARKVTTLLKIQNEHNPPEGQDSRVGKLIFPPTTTSKLQLNYRTIVIENHPRTS